MSDYLPGPKNGDTRLVQAKVDGELFERFIAVQKAKKLKWVDFIEASMKMYLDENKVAK